MSVKVGILRPVQQPEIYWDRPLAWSPAGVAQTQFLYSVYLLLYGSTLLVVMGSWKGRENKYITVCQGSESIPPPSFYTRVDSGGPP